MGATEEGAKPPTRPSPPCSALHMVWVLGNAAHLRTGRGLSSCSVIFSFQLLGLFSDYKY